MDMYPTLSHTETLLISALVLYAVIGAFIGFDSKSEDSEVVILTSVFWPIVLAYRFIQSLPKLIKEYFYHSLRVGLYLAGVMVGSEAMKEASKKLTATSSIDD